MSNSPTMKAVRLPEGGRAALSFAFEGDWDKTQRDAMYGANRSNILRNWSQFPRWLRHDPGFECLMDHFGPINEETYQLQQARKLDERRQLVRDTVRSMHGTRYHEGKPPSVDEMMAALASLPEQHACVDWGAPFGTSGTTVSTSSTARTIAGFQPRANQSVRFWGFDIGFDGTTSTNGPAIVEIQQDTFATNVPGSNSNTITAAIIDFGRPETIQTTAARSWTTEPTVLTTVEAFFIPNYMGSGIVFTPLTKPYIATSGKCLSMRVTQQSGINGNATGCLKAEE